MDPEIAQRIRELLEGEPGVAEMNMFGGRAFLVNGNLAVAADSRGGVMLRAGEPEAQELERSVSIVPVEMRGKAMTGWYRTERYEVDDDAALAQVVAAGVTCARKLPPK